MSSSLFFILASPRSGTTLLERLLNRHSRLFIPPETEFFSLLVKNGLLSRPYTENQARKFISYYKNSLPVKLLGLDLEPVLLEKLVANAENWADIFLRLITLMSMGAGKQRVGEKTPHHIRSLPYLLQAFPEAQFIGIVRDGRAVARSRIAHPEWVPNWYAAAMIWRQDVRMWQANAHGPHSDRMLLVQYERLVSDPETELRAICAFLGEKYESAMLDESLQPGTEQFSAYYQRPWMAKSTTSIDPARATEWINSYSERELALVEHLLRTELEAFGYPLAAQSGARWRGLYLREWLRHQVFRTSRRLGKLIQSRIRSSDEDDAVGREDDTPLF